MKAFLPISLLFGSLLGSFAPVHAQAPAPPTTPDSQLHVVDASCKWAKLGWTNGDGAYRALVVTDLSTASTTHPDVAPAQGQRLFGSPYLGTGGYTNNNAFAVFTDAGNAATVRNLIKGHQYMALLYPYNQNANTGEVAYLLSPGPDTLRFTIPNCPDVSPSIGPSRLRSSGVDCSTVTLTCHPGNGQGRLFVIRKSSANHTGEVGIDQESYLFPSNQYARGFETRPGSAAYAVYAGTDSTVTVYGLAPDQVHMWTVYEYNTVPGPEGFPDGVTPFYKGPAIFAGPAYVTTYQCTGGEPGKSSVDDRQHQTTNAAVLPGTLRTTSVGIKWHPSITPAHYAFGNSGPVLPAAQYPSDGVGSYVVINNAFYFNPLPLPLQNTVPARLSTVYGLGSPVRPGMDSIYSVKLTYGVVDTTVAITNLRPNTTYTVNVFTFRFPDAGGTAPFTYLLSIPQASVTFTTPALAPLPVSLVSFAATHRSGSPNVQLTWQTASELNNAGFGIERSLDGRAWTRLGFVPGSGTSTSLQSYVVPSPYVGAAYYRLRQEDLGGKATYSPVCYVRDEKTVAPLAIYPNPARAEFTVVGAAAEQPVEIFDMVGLRVLVLPAGATTGTLATLPAGIYLVRQGTAHTRLVRQ